MAASSRTLRLLRHRWQNDARRAVSRNTLAQLTERVAASERRHTGQIRIYIEAGLPTHYIMRNASARDRAVAMFGKLRVWDTQHNNGVLIYLLLAERAIEIVADRGVTSAVPDSEWQRIVDSMREAFRAGRFEDGLNAAVDAVTGLLARHFPRAAADSSTNELPDEPVLG